MQNDGLGKRSGGGLDRGHIYDCIIAPANLFAAWRGFSAGKTSKADVLFFAKDLEQNVFDLHSELRRGAYRHGSYESFFVCDPKRRHIHKAAVRDRLLHHAAVRVLTPIFDPAFIFDSYSSRRDKGTHKAIVRFREFAWKLSRNNTRAVWILKCDIRKFFDSVDHAILLALIKKKISDKRATALLGNIISSFNCARGVGLPLGNLTSQLFANIYLDWLDQFMKRERRVKYYLRYADDFIILSYDRDELLAIIPIINCFLREELKLELHKQKTGLDPWHRGTDFLGFVHFPHYSVLRTKTKKRMFRKLERSHIKLKHEELSEEKFSEIRQSYLGLLKHGRCSSLAKRITRLDGGNDDRSVAR